MFASGLFIYIMKKTILKILLAFSIGVIPSVLKSVTGLSVSQSVILGALFAVIFLWVSEAIPKWVSSVFLLGVFTVFSGADIKKIFMFPLSDNFLLILFSYLFSQGLRKSHLFDPLIPFLNKRIKSVFSFSLWVFLITLISIWIIPQQFTRMIIILQLFNSLFDVRGYDSNTKSILGLAIVNSSILINSAFLRGDLVLNTALVSIGDLSFSEMDWIRWMSIPTIVFCIICMAGFYCLFRKRIGMLNSRINVQQNGVLSVNADKKVLIISIITVVLWLTESITGVPAYLSVIGATVSFFFVGALKIEDLKCINYELLIFLTAAFSIGPAMTASGLSNKIFSMVMPFIPDTVGISFILVIVAICIAVHSLLGSCVTALSLMIPGIILVVPQDQAVPILLIAFMTIVAQYFLPVHNVSLMVGAGTARYKDQDVAKCGLLFSVLVISLLPLIYSGYWKIAGLW